jgi:predicted secreted protein
MVDAIESQGFLFQIGNEDSPLTYTNVVGVTSFNGFDGQAAEIDVTTLQSTAKEYLMGLQDFGSFTIETNYISDDVGQGKMRDAKESRDVQDFKITFSDTSIATFQGYVMSAPVSGAVDGKVDGSFAIRITGDVTFA